MAPCIRIALTTSHYENIWRCIGYLQKGNSKVEVTVEQYVVEYAPPPKKRKYIGADVRLKNLVFAFQNFDTDEAAVEYLSGIAHNIAAF